MSSSTVKQPDISPAQLISRYALPATVISLGFALGAPWLVSKGVDAFTAFVAAALPWFVLVIGHIAVRGRRDGSWSLNNLTPFSEPLPGLRTVPICLAALVLIFLLYGLGDYLVTPLSTWVQTWLPAWHFDNQNTQKIMAEMLGERGTLELVALLVSVNVFIGILMPTLEELYFTGVLLPKAIDRWGKAVLCSTPSSSRRITYSPSGSCQFVFFRSGHFSRWPTATAA